jgi:hypothetical protein
MRLKLTVFVFAISGFIASGQRLHIELMAGVSNYQGDLLPIVFTFKQSQPAFNANVKYQLSDHFYLRGGISAGSIRADDKKNRDYLQPRNLNFKSNIAEMNIGLEYDVFNVEKICFTPYFFSGIGVFHYNPYTYNNAGERIYLKPLSTEGQGLSEYPARKPYQLTQACVPLVAGLKYAPCINLQISYEFGFRKLFTDYLDDVSESYVAEEVLLHSRGPRAVEISYRGDELAGGNSAYPTSSTQRGNKKEMDWYYFTGFKVSVRLGAGGICNKKASSWKELFPYSKSRCPLRVY